MPLDYAPDASRLTPGVLSVVTDFFPNLKGNYVVSPAPFTEAYPTPLANNDVIGSAIITDTGGSRFLYAGTQGKLFVSNSNGTATWVDVSGGAYGATATGTWDFAQFTSSASFAIAANGVDALQVEQTGGALPFAAIATAPAAKLVIVHENAVLAFNTPSKPDGWYRSDTGDHTNWTAAAANDVDSGNLRGDIGGAIVAATVFGSLAIAWKSGGMYAGVFTGGAGGAGDPKIRWEFVPGGKGIGCAATHAHVSTDAGLFFVSQRDIMLFDGSTPRSVADKVRKGFFSLVKNKAQIFLTHDEIERCIYIWYPGTATFANHALIYNYQTQKWGDLTTIQNSTDGPENYLRCPVRAANYTDYTGVISSKIATNSGGHCNAVWGSPVTGSRLLNFAVSGSALRNAGPNMTTGYFGNPAKDSTLSRTLVVRDPSSVLPTAPSSATGFSYNSSLVTSAAFTGAIDGDGHVDVGRQGRFYQESIFWPTATLAGEEVMDIVHQGPQGEPLIQSVGGRR